MFLDMMNSFGRCVYHSGVPNCTVHTSTEQTHHFIEYTVLGKALKSPSIEALKYTR